MRILMLGNSFTYYNDMPEMLAELTGAKVVANTLGGALLADQLDPQTELGRKALEALSGEPFDYVVLQEQSRLPVAAKAEFMNSVSGLCSKIKDTGATPVLYATWPYRQGGEIWNRIPFDYEFMAAGLYEAYHEAAKKNNALVADVGEAFCRKAQAEDLYDEDGVHPNAAGSRLAAEIIAKVIMADSAVKP